MNAAPLVPVLLVLALAACGRADVDMQGVEAASVAAPEAAHPGHEIGFILRRDGSYAVLTLWDGGDPRFPGRLRLRLMRDEDEAYAVAWHDEDAVAFSLAHLEPGVTLVLRAGVDGLIACDRLPVEEALRLYRKTRRDAEPGE